MAWYEKGKVPEWHKLIDSPYSVEALLAHKDILLQELPKVEELQGFVKTHRQGIIADCLALCLQPPNEASSYDRKYSFPTKAIELMTCEFFFTSLCMDRELIARFVALLFEHFLSVDPHADNINLYHAYLQRLIRMLVGCRAIDKIDVAAAFEQEQANKQIIEKLFKHSHKLSVCCCLQIMFTLDFVEPLVTISLEFKTIIANHIFAVLSNFARQEAEPEKIENCLQIMKAFFERGINFLVAKRSQLDSPLSSLKVDTLFGVYSIFQVHFASLLCLVTANSEACIKILILQLLQLNQILLSQPEARLRQLPLDWSLSQCQSLVAYFLSTRVSLAHPAFIDWLSICFAEVGQHEGQVRLLREMRVLQGVIGMMLGHRSNNILNAKIFQFLKIIFHNVAEGEVIACIEKHKATPNSTHTLHLLPYFLDNLSLLQATVRQFKTINDPLFVTLYTLFKIISQYCRNIDSIFNLYAQLQVCQAYRPSITHVIDFQRQEQCFMVFEREAAKDLGKFYTDDMFINQKPIQFTVKPLPAALQQQPQQAPQPLEIQALITIPPPSASVIIAVPPNLQAPEVQAKNQEIKLTYLSKSETNIPESEPIQQPSCSQSQNEQDQSSNQNSSNKFGTFIRDRLRQVESNIDSRKSKSKTPTKIKNQLKKAKNKWVVSADEPEQDKSAFSCEVKLRTPKAAASPKLTKALIDCNSEKIALIRVSKNRLPPVQKQRLLTPQRDNRLLGWLSALRA